MKAVAEFVPRHLEKALDLARHVATFGRMEFTAGGIKLRVIDPAKVIYVDLDMRPTHTSVIRSLVLGSIWMLDKLFRSLDNNEERRDPG
jgi:hypothetical protein